MTCRSIIMTDNNIIILKARRNGMTAANHQPDQAGQRIYPEGRYRWSALKDVLPVSRETWRLQVKQGKAPQPERMGTRCTYWRGSDVLAYLADPKGYVCHPGQN